MTGKLSATLRELQQRLDYHSEYGMPISAKDAAKLADQLRMCANYAATMERKLGITGFSAAPESDGKVLRFPPRVRVVVTQSVTPPEGDSA
ncbi:MAG: hypothetical protein ABL901_20245 [Hyphomicrobiaceae bacterium]